MVTSHFASHINSPHPLFGLVSRRQFHSKIMENDNKEIEALNDNFSYNSMLARALVQLFAQEERAQIHMWLEKLQRVPRDDVDAMIIRNEYMWLLLLVMQSGNLTEPFDKLPPYAEELPPVSDIMPTRIYQEVLGSSEQNFSWIDKVLSETNAASAADEDNDVKVGIAPHTFLDHQPRPLNGIACYFSVFSNKS
ncbi:uncharacterized protein [Neodiprion pinetum]|uniref:uncharacterized protein n=1 Tax=Neodiprion pinetum TaxID=441929 RepID=UPI0037231132